MKTPKTMERVDVGIPSVAGGRCKSALNCESYPTGNEGNTPAPPVYYLLTYICEANSN